MGRAKKVSDTAELNHKFNPAYTTEAREQQMISLAMDRAEAQLRDGTASSQVIVHYLKLGAANARLETEKLEKEVELLKAKTEAYESAKDIKALYSSALESMRIYGGHVDSDEYED